MPFVGRTQELGLIDRAIASALDGRAALVLLTGEPGIGKTSLADAAMRAATDAGFVHTWARCWELGGAPALWPWMQVARSWSRDPAWTTSVERLGPARGALAMLEGDDVEIDAKNARLQLRRAIGELARELGVARPRAIVLDDLHAADVASLQLLDGVLADARDARLLIVGTYRDVQADPSPEVRELLAKLGRAGKRIQLGGLGEHDVGLLVEDALGRGASATLASELRGATGGNPFFLGEVLTNLAVTGSRTAPPAVRDAITAQLDRLDASTNAVLDAMAVIGRPASPLLISSVAAIDGALIGSAIEHARRERVLVEGEPGLLVFAHALIRDTVAARVVDEQRRLLHRRSAAAIATATNDPMSQAAEIARHHVATFDHGDERARSAGLQWSHRAGERAMRATGWEDAAAHFATAARLASDPAGLRRELLAQGDAELAAGKRAQAAATFRSVYGLADLPIDLQLDEPGSVPPRVGDDPLADLARAAIGIGRTLEFVQLDHTVIALLEHADAAIVDHPETVLRARVKAQLALALWMDPHARARRDVLSAEAVAIARGVDDPALLASTLDARIAALQGPDGLDQRIAMADEIIKLATAANDLFRLADGLRWRVGALFAKGDMVAVDRDIEAAARIAEELKAPQLLVNATMRRGLRAMLAGRWDEARARVDETRALSAAMNDPMGELVYACCAAAIAIDRGEPVDQTILDDLARGAEQLHWGVFIRSVYARTLAAIGRRAEARAELARVVEGDFARLPRDFVHLTTLVCIAEVAIAVEDREVATRVRGELLPYAGQLIVTGSAFSLGSSWRFLGRLAIALGDLETGRAELERAVAHDAAMGAWPAHAHDLVELAAITTEMPRRRELAVDAARRARELGMQRVAARADELASGLPAPPPKRERRIVELVRSGDAWTVAVAGTSASLRDRRGLGYLARLLGEPGRALHVLDLADASDAGDGVPALDPRAKAAYRERLSALRERAGDAEARGDVAVAEAAHAEIEALAGELAKALGLGGRDRKAGGAAERARSAVTLAIRRAIEAIATDFPELARHLEVSVKTGMFCEYRPDPHAALEWRVTS